MLNVSAILLVLGYIFELAFSTAMEGEPKIDKPNIILIVADDLGFNDVPWHNDFVFAPNLKKLAKDGVILEQSYVLPICSPTRSALLTGIYPFAIGRQGDVIWPLIPTGLTTDAYIIPQLLKPLGYTTHAVGKWHLGFCNWKYTPTERGFDTFRGYYTGSEDYFSHRRTWDYKEHSPDLEDNLPMPNDDSRDNEINQKAQKYPLGYDFRDNRKPYINASGEYSTYEFASHVESLFRTSDPAVPKFVYMAFQSVHAPLQVPENYTERYKNVKDKNRRTYLGMVTAMDEAIGRIVRVLNDTGHYNNSVIVFTTDNGGPTVWGGNNWPLRGNKTTLWEGGTRGAAFIHSPFLANKGTVSKNLIHVTDWMATLVNLAGGLSLSSTDSIDQWESLNGRAPPPRNEIVYDYNKKKGLQAAIRVGDYKLIIGNPGPGEWIPPPENATSEHHTNSVSLNKFRKKASKRFIQLMQDQKKHCKTLQCFKNYLKFYRMNMGKKTSRSNKIIIDFKKIDKRPMENKTFPEGLTNAQGLSVVEHTLVVSSEVKLFNLVDDPQERNNLAEKRKDKVVELTKHLLAYRSRYRPPDEPKSDQRGDPKFWNGAWSPGWC